MFEEVQERGAEILRNQTKLDEVVFEFRRGAGYQSFQITSCKPNVLHSVSIASADLGLDKAVFEMPIQCAALLPHAPDTPPETLALQTSVLASPVIVTVRLHTTNKKLLRSYQVGVASCLRTCLLPDLADIAEAYLRNARLPVSVTCRAEATLVPPHSPTTLMSRGQQIAPGNNRFSPALGPGDRLLVGLTGPHPGGSITWKGPALHVCETVGAKARGPWSMIGPCDLRCVQVDIPCRVTAYAVLQRAVKKECGCNDCA